MDIRLTPKSEELIRQKMSNGRCASASEVVEAAVLLLDERDRFEYLRGLILEAEEDIESGRTLEWTPELHRQLRREAEEMMRRGIPPDPDVCP
jgi:putative addiction module CopG family antidote